jgi:hypothetical protein
MLANFGTWSVNESDKTLTRHNDGALAPNVEGTDTKASSSLAGGELRLSAQPIAALGAAASETVYRRAK